jgi:hypothetical protein
MNRQELETMRKLLDYSSPCQFVNPREWNFKRDMAYLILDREENRIDRRYFESQICLVKREMEKAKCKQKQKQ